MLFLSDLKMLADRHTEKLRHAIILYVWMTKFYMKICYLIRLQITDNLVIWSLSIKQFLNYEKHFYEYFICNNRKIKYWTNSKLIQNYSNVKIQESTAKSHVSFVPNHTKFWNINIAVYLWSQKETLSYTILHALSLLHFTNELKYVCA